MKSMQVLIYKPDTNTIETRARDYRSNWMSAVTMLDDDTYLGAENSYNMFVVRKNSDAATDEERSRLEVRNEIELVSWLMYFGRDNQSSLCSGRLCSQCEHWIPMCRLSESLA